MQINSYYTVGYFLYCCIHLTKGTKRHEYSVFTHNGKSQAARLLKQSPFRPVFLVFLRLLITLCL